MYTSLYFKYKMYNDRIENIIKEHRDSNKTYSILYLQRNEYLSIKLITSYNCRFLWKDVTFCVVILLFRNTLLNTRY